MTTKDFNRKVDFFKSLDQACELFDDFFSLYASDSSVSDPFIYRVTLVYSNSVVHTFSAGLYYFLPDKKVYSDVEHLYYDKFTLIDFDVQLKYFISFYNSCTELQRSKLRSLSDLSNLIKRV